MLDVLLVAGNIWQTLVREVSVQAPFRFRIFAPSAAQFGCGNGVPVIPDCHVVDNRGADIVILP